MSLKRIRVKVAGRVQGVFFRAYTRDEAKRYCLRGWVRNMPDGSVEAEVEGEERDVDRMRAWFHQGSPQSLVRDVTETPCEPLNSETDFVVRY